MDVTPNYLRFLFASCAFGIVFGVMGCATNNWSQSLMGNQQTLSDSLMGSYVTRTSTEEQKKEIIKAPKPFWKQGFGDMSGIDPRSREIERSLGF